MPIIEIYESYPTDEGGSRELSNDRCMELSKLPLNDMYRIVGGVALHEEQPLEAFKRMAGSFELPEHTLTAAA